MSKGAHGHPKVSVLIPIYNVEKYLPQCLDSVCQQNLDDIEIICINDGSTDDSLNIIKQYQKADKRIKLIDKTNSGYGDSMNQGLDLASGEYIGIVEPDDWIELDGFEELYSLAKEYRADVARANYYQNKEGRDEKWRYIPIHETMQAICPREHTWLFLQAPAIWSAIYRREFLDKYKIRFLPTPGASYQDTGFNFKVMSVAKRVVLTTNAYIHYRVDNDSSSVNNPGKTFCIVDEYHSIEEFLKNENIFGELGIMMWNAIGYGYFWNAFRLKPELRRQFLTRVTDEYVAANEEGLVFPDLFLGPIREFVRSMSEGDVERAMKILKREHKLTNRYERRQKIRKMLRPMYAKQLEIEKAINNLDSQNEYLEQQIKRMQIETGRTHE